MTEPVSAASMLGWAEWNPSRPFTVGLEEEVMLLDPDDGWALACRIDEVLPGLSAELRPQVTAETQDAVLELATAPHERSDDAAAQARELRATLARELAPMGLRPGCAGTHPGAVWTETRIAGGARHQLVYGAMRELARREPTFGLHVHVGVSDPDAAIILHNRMRTHLPLLLALSANSPYWQGRDSGLASARTPIFQAFPRVGTPRGFDSYDEYVDTVDRLIRCQAFPDPTFLWWDVRPAPKFGTVEVRIMDVQIDSASTAALVALVQSIARLELEEGYHTDPVAGNMEVLVENRFLASRDGLEAQLIDPVTERRVPVGVATGRLIDAARPHAEALGCVAALESVADLARRNGAERQRSLVTADDDLTSLVRALARGF